MVLPERRADRNIGDIVWRRWVLFRQSIIASLVLPSPYEWRMALCPAAISSPAIGKLPGLCQGNGRAGLAGHAGRSASDPVSRASTGERVSTWSERRGVP